MDKESSEIVVLRPTPVFFYFLISQLGEQLAPSMEILSKNNTAYLIKKYTDNDATLNELERIYPKMFRYEISRWLGPNARNRIERSFLDFLCCFKLEFHSHIILLEPSFAAARQMVQLKPRIKLLQWLNRLVAYDEDLSELMEEVTLARLTENATVVLKNFTQLCDIKTFIYAYYKPLFEAALKRISAQKRHWPQINSIQDFKHYFEIEIHTQLHSEELWNQGL